MLLRLTRYIIRGCADLESLRLVVVFQQTLPLLSIGIGVKC
jgi:hypothetical protein